MEKLKCFVIMPFSNSSKKHTAEYWTKRYKNLLKPLIEEVSADIEVERSTVRREDLLGEIVKNIVTADIVVADLTDLNPNVFWELGIRQSFKHGTVTIAESGTKLPFDVSKKGTHFYFPSDTLKDADFRRKFKKAIEDCISNPLRPDSIILEAIGGRGSLFELIRSDEAKRRIKAIIKEIEHNKKLFQGVIKRAKLNAEIRKLKINSEENKEKLKELGEGSFSTGRFRVASLELLITNRYIDEDEKFYDEAEKLHSSLVTKNDQLRIWETVPPATEEWFIKLESYYSKQIDGFTSIVEKANLNINNK